MDEPIILAAGISGLPVPAGDYNGNWFLIEQAFLGIAPVILSGLMPSPVSGQAAVTISAGVVLLGAPLTMEPFFIESLSPNTLNHLFLLQSGAGICNTTGIPPAASVCLGTAQTDAGTVMAVNTSQSSGRHQFILPQDLVLGGPGAGNPASQNLASWAAAAGDGVSFYGSLPNQAVGNGRQPLTSVTTTYAIAATDYYVLGNTTAAGFTVTLPTAVGVSGKEYVIKSTGTANNLTVQTTLAQTIDGSAPPVVLTTLQHIKVVADGSGWWLV